MAQTIKFLVSLLMISATTYLPAAEGDSANLLGNPGFDEGLGNWTPSNSSDVAWVTNYDAPPPGITSLGAAAVFHDGNLPQDLHQCVGIQSPSKLGTNVRYTVSVWAIFSCPRNASIEIDWNPRSDCSDGEGIVVDNINLDAVPDSWQQLRSVVDVPDNAQSALFVLQNLNACNQAVIFDSAYFGDRIFDNSFE